MMLCWVIIVRNRSLQASMSFTALAGAVAGAASRTKSDSRTGA